MRFNITIALTPESAEAAVIRDGLPRDHAGFGAAVDERIAASRVRQIVHARALPECIRALVAGGWRIVAIDRASFDRDAVVERGRILWDGSPKAEAIGRALSRALRERGLDVEVAPAPRADFRIDVAHAPDADPREVADGVAARVVASALAVGGRAPSIALFAEETTQEVLDEARTLHAAMGAVDGEVQRFRRDLAEGVWDAVLADLLDCAMDQGGSAYWIARATAPGNEALAKFTDVDNTRHVLDLPAAREALVTLRRDWNERYQRVITGQWDAEDADVWLQLATLGDVIYG